MDNSLSFLPKKAVIPAAGIGTRMLPATKAIAKELIPIIDRPAIHYVIEEAYLAGLREVIFVVSDEKEKALLEYFLPNPKLLDFLKKNNKTSYLDETLFFEEMKFATVIQKEAKGLGHAVLCAKEFIDPEEFFFVLLPDDLIAAKTPVCAQMIRTFEKNKQSIVAVMPVAWDFVDRYGVVQASPISSQLGQVQTLVEKPKREEAPSNLVVIGRYLLHAKVFDYLEQTKPGAIGEIQLTDALLNLAQAKGLLSFAFEGERFDTGNKLGLIEAILSFALRREDIKEDVKKLISLLAN